MLFLSGAFSVFPILSAGLVPERYEHAFSVAFPVKYMLSYKSIEVHSDVERDRFVVKPKVVPGVIRECARESGKTAGIIYK
jgi:hypothetical protein